jgi:hypothetical protein
LPCTRALLRRLFCALIVTLTLAVGPADVARADLGACFTALAPVGQAAKAAEVGSTAAACLSAASGDPIMAMTIAAMTSAAIGGLFSTIGECNDLIDTSLGQVIAAALLTLPLPLNDDQRKLLEQFAKGNMPPGISFRELIAAIPGLNALSAYMQCGCNVAGAPGEFAKIAKEYADSVEECGNFFTDAGEAFLEWVGSGFESLFGGHDFVPGPQEEYTCYVYTMPPDIWTATTIRPESRGCGSHVCPAGYVIAERTVMPSGTKQYKCTEKCPEAPIVVMDNVCYAQDNITPVNRVCQFTGVTVQCCDKGQRVDKTGACLPACPAGYQYWDTQAGQCRNCSTGWYPDYQSANNSIGECVECPSGERYDFIAKKCQPLECRPPFEYFDANKPHECAYCPPGELYSASTNKCECSLGTFEKGGACQCPEGAMQMNWSATFTCACPERSTFDSEKLACVCPAGEQMQKVNVAGSTYTSCVPITQCRSNAIRTADGRCKQCGRGRIAQGNECIQLTVIRRRVEDLFVSSGTRTVGPAVAVEPCPRGSRRVRGSCVPPKIPPALTSKPVLRCPPGTVPNARGTGCVRNVPAATRSILDSGPHPGTGGLGPPVSGGAAAPGMVPGMMRVAPR